MLSLLQLEQYWIEKLELRLEGEELPSKPTPSRKVRLDVQSQTISGSEKSREFSTKQAISLEFEKSSLKSQQGGVPIKSGSIDIVLIGKFVVNPIAKEELISTFKDLNAPAVLYGVARGIVSSLTCLSALGRVDLPIVNLKPRSVQKPLKGEIREEKQKPRKVVRGKGK